MMCQTYTPPLVVRRNQIGRNCSRSDRTGPQDARYPQKPNASDAALLCTDQGRSFPEMLYNLNSAAVKMACIFCALPSTSSTATHPHMSGLRAA